MYIKKKYFLSLSLCFFAVFTFFGLFTQVFAEDYVPETYHANYHIKTEREELLNLIIDIEASQKVGAEFTTDQFAKLNSIFSKVFTYFPSSPENRLIYKQCDLTTKALMKEITRNDYAIFKDRCFWPIGNLIKQIQSKFTVKAEINVKPKQGSAPLNVTFDARASKDPSSDTIPSDNFFRYYKDVHGDDRMIGKWPVVNYTFTEPGNHIVHLTVRSANNTTKGIFDGSDDVSVNIAPKAADIVVRINNHILSTDNVFRIGTHDAKKGILIDGTSITPIGARTILEYTWKITSTENSYTFKKSGKWTPWQFIHKFPENWKYFISISLVDNENNKLSEKYEISVSDPVAIIKMRPSDGSTSDEYLFDASASYSLTSRVKKYEWLIRDAKGHEEIIESKKVKRKLPIPGTSLVKLTVTDEMGNSSYDEQSFYVKSTPPVPSFTIVPTSQLKNPSQFLLDASATFDADVLSAHDTLSYDWSISPDNGVVMETIDNDPKNTSLTFNKTGKYIVKLRVNDSYGESVEIEKNIKVESVLRPEIAVRPFVSKRWEKIAFTATVNQDVAFYEWNFGDGKTQKSDKSLVFHTYDKAGVYTVSLHVVNNQWEENIVKKQVFMGQKNMPIVAYEVKVNQNNILQANGLCTLDDGTTAHAYDVDRYEHFIFDASKSVNTQWWITDLSVTLHPQNDEVFTKAMMDYNFLEVGCHYIDIFVEDKNLGKTDTVKVWFNVHNALPTLKNLILSFPQTNGQQSNSIWIGNTPLQSNTQNVLWDKELDPIFVEVHAEWAQDPDGFISHYAWYYYETKNPDNIISLKITPSNVSHTTFVISKPRYAAEYSFAVRMVDNDGAEVTSEDVLGQGPVVFFPPGENNLDVPIVTLTTNGGYVKVWEEVTFTTQSEILSQRPDFASARYFKYDFDGDGEYDMTTKKEKVTYTYQKPGEKHPKVTVFYRWRAWVGMSEKIIVQKWLKPKLLFDIFDNKVLIKDVSIGDIDTSELCLDTKKCEKDDHRLLHDVTSSLFAYDEYGKHDWTYNVLDTYGNRQSIWDTLTLQHEKTPWVLWILSIPQANDTDSWYEISVGNTLKNTILLYIDYTDGNCFIDSDITIDGDNDGDPLDDKDMSCNEMHDIVFTPTKPEQMMRIYYVTKDKTVKANDIRVLFLDFEEHIDEAYQEIADTIQQLIESIDDSHDDMLVFYKTLLVNLKSSLGEKNTMNGILIQLRQLLDEQPNIVNQEQRQKTLDLIDSLSDSDVTEVLWWSTYDTAKINTLAWFNEATKEEVTKIFKAFEESEGASPDERKKILDDVIRVAAKARDIGEIDISDYNYIQKNLCEIIKYYEFPSKQCGTAVEVDQTLIDDAETDSWKTGWKSVWSSILRIIVIIVIVLAIIFGGLVLFFAIKSRRHGDDDEDDEEDEDDLDEE